jgi:hypothetical protein
VSSSDESESFVPNKYKKVQIVKERLELANFNAIIGVQVLTKTNVAVS